MVSAAGKRSKFKVWFLLNVYCYHTILKKRFHLFIHERHRERERQREKQAPCREPNVGLDPGTPTAEPPGDPKILIS